jgi:hypothetical protein
VATKERPKTQVWQLEDESGYALVMAIIEPVEKPDVEGFHTRALLTSMEVPIFASLSQAESYRPEFEEKLAGIDR